MVMVTVGPFYVQAHANHTLIATRLARCKRKPAVTLQMQCAVSTRNVSAPTVWVPQAPLVPRTRTPSVSPVQLISCCRVVPASYKPRQKVFSSSRKVAVAITTTGAGTGRAYRMDLRWRSATRKSSPTLHAGLGFIMGRKPIACVCARVVRTQIAGVRSTFQVSIPTV